MAKVIGIMGLAGAGKDTVAAMLQRGLVSAGGQHIKLGKFAAHMYGVAGEVFTQTSLTDRGLKETPHVFNPTEFHGGLLRGIEKSLGVFLDGAQQAQMYDFMCDAMYRFWDHHGGVAGLYRVSPRQFLQYLGDVGKLVVPELWTKLAFADWASFDGIVICTDARFPAEVAQVDRLIFVKRPGLMPVNPHVSEALAIAINDGSSSVPGIEFIDNDGTLGDLEAEVAAMAASFAPIFAGAF